MQKFKIFIGVSALCLLFSFNLRHALNDYGVSDPNNELHPQVLAQTNTVGDGGGTPIITFPALCMRYEDECLIPPCPAVPYWIGLWPYTNIW